MPIHVGASLVASDVGRLPAWADYRTEASRSQHGLV